MGLTGETVVLPLLRLKLSTQEQTVSADSVLRNHLVIKIWAVIASHVSI